LYTLIIFVIINFGKLQIYYSVGGIIVETIIFCDYLNQVIKNNNTGIIVDWKKVKEDTESDDLQVAAMGRKATRMLVFLKVLTPIRKEAWSFDDLRMNPYLGSVDEFATERGRVFFVKKEDAIDYGRVNWIWRMDDWIIRNGQQEVTRLGICQ
jgi:hypothetical protein